jgi:arginine repressor
VNNYASTACRRPDRPRLAAIVRDSVQELRQAQHLLLLRTKRGQARLLATKVEKEWPEVLCAVAATDLLVLVTASGKTSLRLRKIIGEWMSQ